MVDLLPHNDHVYGSKQPSIDTLPLTLPWHLNCIVRCELLMQCYFGRGTGVSINYKVTSHRRPLLPQLWTFEHIDCTCIQNKSNFYFKIFCRKLKISVRFTYAITTLIYSPIHFFSKWEFRLVHLIRWHQWCYLKFSSITL